MDNKATAFASYLKGLLGDEVCKTPIVFVPNSEGENTDVALGTVYEGKKFRLVIEPVEDES